MLWSESRDENPVMISPINTDLFIDFTYKWGLIKIRAKEKRFKIKGAKEQQ